MSPRRGIALLLVEHGPHTSPPQCRQLYRSRYSCASPLNVLCHVKGLLQHVHSTDLSYGIHTGGSWICSCPLSLSSRSALLPPVQLLLVVLLLLVLFLQHTLSAARTALTCAVQYSTVTAINRFKRLEDDSHCTYLISIQ